MQTSVFKIKIWILDETYCVCNGSDKFSIFSQLQNGILFNQNQFSALDDGLSFFKHQMQSLQLKDSEQQ